MNASKRLTSAALLALGVLNACDDPLKRAQDLDEPRVLGATVRVVGDKARAEPNAGETVSVEFVAGSPDPLQAFGWAFEVCWAKATSFGVGECDAAPFASFASDGTAPSPRAQLNVEVPAASGESRQAATLLFRGAFCPTSGVSLLGFPEGVRCQDATTAPLHAELRVATNPTVPNHNPTFESVRFDGSAWPALALAPTAPSDCAALDTPRVSAGSGQHELGLSFPDAAREALPAGHAKEPTRESLLVSHFSTHGKLARRFSALAADEPNRELSVSWEAPASVGELTPVRFFVWARDLRGGIDFAERLLCVEPRSP